MTSYFEIGGHIVRCETTSQSSLSKPRVSSFSHVKRLSSPPAGVRRRTPDRRPEPENSKSLFQHWKDTSFHGLSEFSDLSRRESIALVRKPYLFGIWGIGVQLEVIEMHHDYFLGL